MDIKIITPHHEITVKAEDLSHTERNALAGLLGLRVLKNDVFSVLMDVPKFKRVEQRDVTRVCPRKCKVDCRVSVTKLLESELSEEQNDTLAALMNKLPEGAVFLLNRHKMSGWCGECDDVHSVSKDSVMLTCHVEGLNFSKKYDI